MKILSVKTSDGPRAGVLVDDEVFDLSALVGTFDPGPTRTFADFGALVQGSAPVLPVLLNHWSGLGDQLAAGGHAKCSLGKLSDLRLGPPVGSPSKILCAGLNYLDHVAEIGAPMPTHPLVFSKLASALTGPFGGIRYPLGVSAAVDYEAELVVVIGKLTHSVPVAQARGAIAGFMVANDVSARDWQFDSDGQLTLGKGFDTFFPTGPWVTTADEVRDPQSLRIRCWVDDELVQDSSTAQMIKGVDELVSWLSRVCTLFPGDVIATGTPPGVGMGRVPPKYLLPGHTVACEIETLGRLSNEVVVHPRTEGGDHGW